LTLLKKLWSKQVYVDDTEQGVTYTPTWIYATTEVQHLINEIVFEASSNKPHTERVRKFLGSGAPLQTLIADISCAAERDGILLDYEAVRMLALNQITPHSPETKVVSNTYRLALDAFFGVLKDTDDYSKMYQELTSGILRCDLNPPKRITGYPEYLQAIRAPLLHPTRLATTVEKELAVARDEHLPPLIKVILICDEIIEFRSFGDFSALMEIIVRTILLSRIGLPGLFGIPLSKMSYDWERGILRKDQSVAVMGSAHEYSEHGYDATPFFHQKLRFCEIGLNIVDEIITRNNADNDRLVAMIHQDYRLNHRQQQALQLFVCNHSKELDSSCYQKEHDITQVTARSDLNKLVELGFLYSIYAGKKVVYRLRPDFSKALKLGSPEDSR
jgi:hypothetical protein